MKHDSKKLVFMVKKYNEFKSLKEFKNIPAHSNGTILYNVHKFEKTSLVNHVLPKRPRVLIKGL